MRHIRFLHSQSHRSDKPFHLILTPENRFDTLTGLLVNPSPTKVGLVITLFQLFPFDFPVLSTLNTSSSATPLTLGNGTLNLAAASFRFCLTILLSCFAFFSCDRSSK